MTTNKALQELGLSDQESTIYLSLLRTSGAIASAVAHDVGIKRTTVYAILKSLTQKGFVTAYYRKSRQLFYAEKPSRVADYFQKKVAEFVDVIPALESLEKKQLKITGLRSIETVQELEKFYEQILTEYKNKEYCAIGNATAWQNLDPEFFIEFRKNRAAANIKTKILITEESKETSPTDPSLKREVKILPKKHSFKSTIDIFTDKILIVSPELSSLAIVIAIPAMVDVFQNMFDMLWEKN